MNVSAVKSYWERQGLIMVTVLALACMGAGIWWLTRSQHRPITADHPGVVLPEGVEMRLNHVTFRGLSNGKIEWQVEADSFDVTKNQTIFRVNGLKKVALLKDGKQQFTLTADHLERNTMTGDITVDGHVNITGDDIFLRMPTVTWNDRLQRLMIPQQCSAQFGDITLTIEQGATYNLLDGTLRSDGRITVGVRGNILHAGGMLLETKQQRFTLYGPGDATLMVDDVKKWANGQALPELPSIPDDVKVRYREYCRQHGI